MTSLKQRYQQKWAKSNAREKLVLALLEAYLPPGFTAELTGLGAGQDDYIPRDYSSPFDAFDITVYYGSKPCCWVEVTGVASSHDMARHPACRGLCVGSWKLGKAREFRVAHRLWFAFVVDENASIRWLPAALLDRWEQGEAPWLRRCRLRRDENKALCLDGRYWKRFGAFLNWLTLHGPVYAARSWG